VILAVPLSRKQIEGAVRLRQQLPQWQLSDLALVTLQRAVTDFGPEACLLRAVATNAIYGTNVLAITRVAKHVEAVLGRHDLSQAGPELVLEMATVPGENGQASRKRTSFASKFCHFFVGAERFPIYDDAARQALKLHFGRSIKAHDYEAFCASIGQLKAFVGADCSTRTLDHYLWLTGMYIRWLKERKRANPVVNAELLKLFNVPTEAQRAELDALLPAILDRAFKGEL
jgi:hypothetical protein